MLFLYHLFQASLFSIIGAMTRLVVIIITSYLLLVEAMTRVGNNHELFVPAFLFIAIYSIAVTLWKEIFNEFFRPVYGAEWMNFMHWENRFHEIMAES